MKFIVAEEAQTFHTGTVMDLCEYLTARVIEPLFAREGQVWDRRFMDFFSFDNSCNPVDPVGTIYLAVPGRFVGRSNVVLDAIVEALFKLGIRTGPLTVARDPECPSVETVTIPITENPTSLIAPPRVNVSKVRGYQVLRDLLGYTLVNGRYEFSADDLLKRLSSITEERIASCTSSPLREGNAVRRLPSPIAMKSIQRCLDEIRHFAQWAQRHNFQQLAAV